MPNWKNRSLTVTARFMALLSRDREGAVNSGVSRAATVRELVPKAV